MRRSKISDNAPDLSRHNYTTTTKRIVASILFSQVLSNVPFVALYNLVMLNNGFGGNAHIGQWMMLASASTIAGNLTILGAASNIIIIIDVAESVGSYTYILTHHLMNRW